MYPLAQSVGRSVHVVQILDHGFDAENGLPFIAMELLIIAYECLTGLRPFDKETLGALLMAICNEPLPVPSTVAPVPAGFDAWFAKVAARKPEERFASAAEAAAELRVVCGNSPGRPSNAGLPAEPIAPSVANPVFLDQTAAPSSVTMSGAKQTRPTKTVVVAIAALLVMAALFVWLKVLREPAKAVEHATATSAASLSGIQSISTGGKFTCAVVSDSSVNIAKCWGYGSSGQLGTGCTSCNAKYPSAVVSAAGNTLLFW